jgi:hypothetical protein
MPVYRTTPERRFQRTFVKQLADEWRATHSRAKEPVILEEANQKGEVDHIYVIWSDWVHLDRITRGEIIMDAAEKVKSKSDLTKITIAMGLTPEEADRFGLKLRPGKQRNSA